MSSFLDPNALEDGQESSSSLYEYSIKDFLREALTLGVRNSTDDVYKVKALPEAFFRFRGRVNATWVLQATNLWVQDTLQGLAPQRMAKAKRKAELDYRTDAYRDPEPTQRQRALDRANIQSYSYTVLASSRTVRLLSLLPGSEQDTIRVQLSSHELGNLPSFDALSYVWGIPGECSIICDGCLLRIQPNLMSALIQLREADIVRLLWIDAICINQSDTTERDLQVQLMRDIYQQANDVLIWIGIASENTKDGFELLDRLVAKRKVEAFDLRRTSYFEPDLINLELPTVKHRSWKALDEIFWRQWFSRIWIIQELALAKKPYVYCGSNLRTWSDLVEAASYIRDHALPLTTGVDPQCVLKLDEFRSQNDTFSNMQTLLDVLTRARNGFASDDRDKIIGLLGLLDQVSDLYMSGISPFVPRYSDAVELVYTTFAMCVINTSQSLDFLSVIDDRRLRLKLNLPYWVPDWEVHNFSMPFCQLQRFWTWQAFDVPGSSISFQSFGQQGGWEYSIVTKGAIVDKIVSVGYEFSDNVPFSGLVPGRSVSGPVLRQQGYKAMRDALMQQRIREWEQMALKCQMYYSSEEVAFECFIRTITAGASLQCEMHNTVNLREQYDAWRFFWIRVSRKNGRYIHELNKVMEPNRRDLAIDFMQHHYQAAFRRRFFTTKCGYMGLGPSSTGLSDVLVLLHGGRMPYILKKNPRNPQYEFVGEAYVHQCAQRVELVSRNIVDFHII